ncbi:MAG: hypothetical protein JOS17DRAFT_780407 [Linnemannia elongata]|nr:MAG: hypothetical protein JOS17DRAFT_780407 [Linnemannia elongata]
MTLKQHFNHLLEDQWSFLGQQWPYVQVGTNNHTVNQEIAFIKTVKSTLMKRHGAIQVFFFLKYPGPYRKVEKVLRYFTTWLKTEYTAHDKFITSCFESMFSTITIRLLSAKKNNPPLFKHLSFTDGGSL